jgi:transposase InsO family protein
VIDLGSRRVVGWATADYLRTDLIAEALNNAVTQRPESGVIFHFRRDRGCPTPAHVSRSNTVGGTSPLPDGA